MHDLLIRNAALVFAAKGFHDTSVAGICREAKVANGSFYQYFKTKHDIFSAIIDMAGKALVEALEHCIDDNELSTAIFDYFDEYGSLFQVFRETEFVEAADRSHQFYIPIIAHISNILSIDEAQAWAYFGAQTFVALNFGMWKNKPVPQEIRESFLNIARHGISPGATNTWLDLTSPVVTNLKAKVELDGRAAKTRSALVDSARKLFATKGYGSTTIAEITKLAEVALGTFYVHFTSKQAILAELVEEIRNLFVARVQKFSQGDIHRIEVERRNLLSFMTSLSDNSDTYRIVREAEFASPLIGQGYYEKIAKGYVEVLTPALERGELYRESLDVMAWMIMGTAHTAGMRWVLWEDGEYPSTEALRSTLQWLFTGSDGCNFTI
jgi:AcrR family transcriptional regulator